MGRTKIIILRILNIESSDCYFYLYKVLLCRTFKIDDEADTRPKSEAGVGVGTAGRLLKNTKNKKPLNCTFLSCHIQSKTSAGSLPFLPFSLTFALVKVTSDLQVANANCQFSGPVLLSFQQHLMHLIYHSLFKLIFHLDSRTFFQSFSFSIYHISLELCF